MQKIREKKDKVESKISHKAALFIAHDIFKQVNADKKKKLQKVFQFH